MRHRFGRPNGIQSFLRADDSDNFIQWHFSLKVDSFYFEVLGSIRFLEFQIMAAEEAQVSSTFEEIVEYLKGELKRNKKEIAAFKKTLEKWDMFLNTYKRVSSLVRSNFDQYVTITAIEPKLPKKAVLTRSEMNKYSADLQLYLKAVGRKRDLGLVVRMLSPVAAESFVNMIIFVLARPEFKSDDRLMESVYRGQIDVRAKTLHVNCIGFTKSIDQDDERFKDFLRLMNKRNDFLHGNVQPAVNKFDKVYFEGTVPIFTEEKDIAVEFAQSMLFQVTDVEVGEVFSAVGKIRELVLECLHPSLREELESILATSVLGWNDQTKRIGRLFPEHLMMGTMIVEDDNDVGAAT